jgi:phenylacetate-CoA ligase
MQAIANQLKRLRLGDVAIRRNPLHYPAAQRTLETLDSAELSARRDWTMQRLGEVLWSARKTPYGRTIAQPGAIEGWPLLEKSRVQPRPEYFCSIGKAVAIAATTGGTSGAPLRLWRSLASIAFEQASIDHMMRKLGADPRDARTAVLRTESIKDPNDFTPPYWISASAGQRMVFSSGHLNTATLDAYAEAFSAFRPQVLLSYPTSLEAFCVLLERAGRTLSIPRALCSSEVLHERVWALAAERLGCSLLDYYGQAERVAFAYAMKGASYRFLPGYAYVEFHPLSQDGEETTYEIVGTSLSNLAMPLIRYRTGDLIRLPSSWGSAQLEELALGVRTFFGVMGRDSDILLTPEGVKITGISHFQRDLRGVRRIQVIQEALDHVRILVLPNEEFLRADRERLVHSARSKLPSSIRLDIEVVEALERTALGKTPFVVHRPAIKQLLRESRSRGN